MHPYGIPRAVVVLTIRVRVEAGGTPAHLSRDRPPPSERAYRAGTSRRATSVPQQPVRPGVTTRSLGTGPPRRAAHGVGSATVTAAPGLVLSE